VETTALGVDPENHAFTPHVTLARMNDARGKELVQEAVRARATRRSAGSRSTRSDSSRRR